MGTWLFVEQFVSANNKGNMNAVHYLPFVSATTGYWLSPAERANAVESSSMSKHHLDHNSIKVDVPVHHTSPSTVKVWLIQQTFVFFVVLYDKNNSFE